MGLRAFHIFPIKDNSAKPSIIKPILQMNKLIDEGFILLSILPDLIDCLQEFIPAREQWQAESHSLDTAQLFDFPWKQVV